MSEAKILDLLVVGGGPAGVAAALRARELGLQALVVEADDVLRRIRDYSKEKLILPGFGGGDTMAFPAGGEWVKKLPFPPIDKDEMCELYKGLCRDGGINVRVGVELVALEDHDAQTFKVKAYDHRQRKDVAYLARHVVLALGRGVPRHFDIPGDTDGIAFRLADPAAYVGAPACVIGGGTSAAEAVIAISQAKAKAEDPTVVHWSYRGDRLPRVSRALAEVFFEAYVGHGNIRYHPHSEPLMVVTGEDRKDYLAIRVDRRSMPGRVTETSLMEFPKDACVACIGEDLPEGLLQSIGIRMAIGGPRRRKRMVVNRCLETERPRVYLVGDILSQAYLETEDFDADPSTFKEIKHRGNIKSALRDGVLVAQVIRQRLDGTAAEAVDITVDDGEPHEDEGLSISGLMARHPAGQAGPAALQAAKASKASGGGSSGGTGTSIAWLMHRLPGGVEGDEHGLAAGSTTTLGSGACDLSFPEDAQMSEQHASLVLTDGGAVLRDDGSTNGVFLAVPSRRKIELKHGDLLRAGRQFLVVEASASSFSVVHYDATGEEKGRHQLSPGTAVLGRKAPDITLDRKDNTLSRRQLAVTVQNGRLLVKDLLSVNGTYLQVQGSVRLEHGDQFLLGQQRFAFSTERDAVIDSGPPAAAASSAKIAIPPAAEVTPTGPSVTFQPSGQVCAVQPGQTLLDIAESNGVKIVAECRSGICGSDPIRIVSGRENLQAGPDDGETETLEDLCGLEAGPCRLACMARVKGPVVVEILER